MGVAWWNLQSQLLVAIQNDDTGRAQQILAAGVDCDARFKFGSIKRPAVCLCVERDSPDLVRLLLDWGCSVNQCDSRGHTPLHLAAGRGHVELLEILLRSRANVHAVDEQNRTPLHWAAQRSSPEVARLLLLFGAAVDASDHDGLTPLLLACMNGCSATAKLLLQYRADPKATDNLGNTALHMAVGAPSTDPELVRLLIEAGANVNALNKAGLAPIHVAVPSRGAPERKEILGIFVNEPACDIDAETPLGHTALHTCVLERDESSALQLLRYRAKPDSVDRLGFPPLFHAARDGSIDLMKLLIACGGTFNPRVQWWTREPQLMADITHPDALRMIHETKHNCLPLSWLCRLAFRKRCKGSSGEVAAAAGFPQPLLAFLDFEDITHFD